MKKRVGNRISCAIYAWAAIGLPLVLPAGERAWLPLEDVRIGGELRERIVRNMQRLEGPEYAPDKVFEKAPTWREWPGDYAGRTILAHVLEARATGLEPKHLAEIMRRVPDAVNELGYCGNALPDAIDEQQLSANGWWLRGLCEYWLWKRDPQVRDLIGRCASNLFGRVRGKCATYPLEMAVREKALKGLAAGRISGVVNGWKISADVACIFIGLDGFVQACSVLGDPALTETARELAGLFRRYDFLKVHAQTHATLAGVRAMIRLYELTGEQACLGDARRVYDLYLRHGMTENYANYNWFGKLDKWTEPCAIVCSYLAAMQLWRHTGEESYRDVGERIYWNALCRAQRREGCFSLDSCPGAAAKTDMLAVKVGDVTWGCNMRGGGGLVRAVEYAVATEGDTVRLLTPRTLTAKARIGAGEVSFAEETDAPFGGTTRVRILASTAGEIAFRVRNSPSQRGRWKAGDVLTFKEEVKVDNAVPPVNPANAPDRVRHFRGVLMYGECGGTEVPVYDLFEHSAATDPRKLPYGLPYDRAAMKVLFDAPPTVPAKPVTPLGKEWRDVFLPDLSNAETEPGVWTRDAEGCLVPVKDKPLLTKDWYERFELEVVYAMGEKGNSGCYIYNTEHPRAKIEIQMQDDQNPDVARGQKPYQLSGAIYGHQAAFAKMAKKAGEWNVMRVIADGKRVRVVLNDVETAHADLSTFTSDTENPEGSAVPPYMLGQVPLARIPTCGRVGFQGLHIGGASSVRIKSMKIRGL